MDHHHLLAIDDTPRSSARTPRRFDPNNDTVLNTLITTPKHALRRLIYSFKEEQRRLTKKSNSAPPVVTDERAPPPESSDSNAATHRKSAAQIIWTASLGLLVYLLIGLAVFILTNAMFSGHKTLVPVDALYFTVVTLCTIGYGDIVPDSTFTKLFTCVFILVGFGFIDILLNGLVTHVLDRQEAVLLAAMDNNRFNSMVFDKEKGRMRVRTKVGLALGVVVLCLALGTLCVHFIEERDWVDSFYLAVTSVTTVGYGDYAFRTVAGRCFAVVWLLLSTLAVARAFMYLTEFRIEKRNRGVAKWMLQKKMTPGEIVAADWDHDGSISKAEYVIYKLKEMQKISQKDIVEICTQFDSLDNNYGGKIAFTDLLEDDDEDDEDDPEPY